MRKIIFPLILLLTISSCYSQAWVYHPFPTTDALWREYRFFPQGLGTSSINHYQNFISGDTLISGKTYHKVYRSGYQQYNCAGPNCGPSSSPPTYYQNQLTGCFREDSFKHIYIPGQSGEELLYDFNLVIGDTIKNAAGVPTHCFSGYYLTVASIDSVLVGGSFHKRFNINKTKSSTTSFTSIIEGVGSATGLFSLQSGYCDYYTYQLLCFMQNNVTVYPDGQSCALAATSGIDEYSQKQITVYPNPGNGIFTFNGLEKESTIEIYDNAGRLVRRTISTDNIQTIILDNKSSGIYFYRIMSTEGNFSGQGKINLEN